MAYVIAQTSTESDGLNVLPLVVVVLLLIAAAVAAYVHRKRSAE